MYKHRQNKEHVQTYCSLITLTTLDNMLVSLAGNIYHRLANPAGDHRHATLSGGLIRRWQLIRPDRGHRVDGGLGLFCK